jgi:Co/Zn/Cd efflux system component
MSTPDSKRVVFAALAGNLGIAVTKFVAFALTGSSAMLTEGIHSVVDTGNQGLLLLGMRRAARPPSRTHPFGYGMELYFWGFVVALMIFALGGAVSIYEGIHKIIEPEPAHDPWVNFVVLAASMVFEGISFRFAWRELKERFPEISPFKAVTVSKDPSVFAVLLEDAAALTGLTLAFAGVGLAYLLDMPILDGAASISGLARSSQKSMEMAKRMSRGPRWKLRISCTSSTRGSRVSTARASSSTCREALSPVIRLKVSRESTAAVPTRTRPMPIEAAPSRIGMSSR